MSDDKIRRLLISGTQRERNRIGKRGLPCMVSGRWLRFGERGHRLTEGEYIHLDVMTNQGEGDRKLCSLVVTREDLLRALSTVKSPED